MSFRNLLFDYLSGFNRTRVSPTVEWTRETISATTRTMDRQMANVATAMLTYVKTHDPGESGLVAVVAAVVAAVVGGEHSLV